MRELRLLHVSCMVKDEGGLWHLLRGLEAYGVHNVEVRPVDEETQARLTGKPVAQPEQPAVPHLKAELVPLPRGQTRHGPNKNIQKRHVILAQMQQHNRPMRPSEIAQSAGLDIKGVANTLWNMMREGLVSRPEYGLYVISRRPYRYDDGART